MSFLETKQKTCQVQDCGGGHKVHNGLCNRHYLQVRRYGKVLSATTRDRRPAIIEGDTAKIPLGLNAKDGYALVDVKFAYLAEDNWTKTHYGYAKRSKDKALMHRLILNTPKNLNVDHKNGDKLDNRMTNIRNCTQAENSKNMKLSILSKTGYKGVYKHPNGRYYAAVKSGYKKYGAGGHDTAVKAAEAYNILAIKLHGDFARLNIV